MGITRHLWILWLAGAATSSGASLAFQNVFGDASGGEVSAMTLDAQGNIYVAGDAGAPSHVFVKKFDPTGVQLLYSKTLAGSGNDYATGLAVDGAGSAYVVGWTFSSDFPVTANAFQQTLHAAVFSAVNAFVAKVSPDGSSLVYSSFFGGGTERSSGIAVDAAGAAYITGTTLGSVPATSGAFQTANGDGQCAGANFFNYLRSGDAYIAKISPDGSSLIYASYLGGSCGEYGNNLAVSPDGSVFVVGATFSPDFPVTPDALQGKFGGGYGDGFLVRVSPAGDRLLYATYLGGNGSDSINAITLDAAGNLYLTGSSNGFPEPASAGAYQAQAFSSGCLSFLVPVFNPGGSAFVMKLDPAADAVTGLTYLGSTCYASGTSIALDPSGAIWIAGTPSAQMPTASPIRLENGGGYVSKFSPDLSKLLASTYFDVINTVAVSPAGMAYVAGSAGPPPTGSPPFSPSRAYLAEIDPTAPAISLDNVLSASPYPIAGLVEAIAPGKVVRLAGGGLGPSTRAPGVVSGGLIATTVAGVRVTFDGVAAPLLYAGATEIECITPFELAGKFTTTMQVTYNGLQSNTVEIPVYPGTPEVLAVLNPDFTLNSAANPAPSGSIMELYLTGAGQTVPPAADGAVNTLPLAQPAGAVSLNDLGTALPVTFAAAADGLAAGILQVNFQAPQTTPDGVVVITVAGFGFGYFYVWVR